MNSLLPMALLINVWGFPVQSVNYLFMKCLGGYGIQRAHLFLFFALHFFISFLPCLNHIFVWQEFKNICLLQDVLIICFIIVECLCYLQSSGDEAIWGPRQIFLKWWAPGLALKGLWRAMFLITKQKQLTSRNTQESQSESFLGVAANNADVTTRI